MKQVHPSSSCEKGSQASQWRRARAGSRCEEGAILEFSGIELPWQNMGLNLLLSTSLGTTKQNQAPLRTHFCHGTCPTSAHSYLRCLSAAGHELLRSSNTCHFIGHIVGLQGVLSLQTCFSLSGTSAQEGTRPHSGGTRQRVSTGSSTPGTSWWMEGKGLSLESGTREDHPSLGKLCREENGRSELPS